ncbi:MAG: serine hydrolase domain-containing protein [Pseudomonadota bacterium]
MSIATHLAQGHCDARFRALADRFESLLASGAEPGGAIAVVADGRLVVDLWGGTNDRETGTPWHEDTLACCFSVTKGVLSLLALRLAEQGRLDLSARVADLWPGFETGGKAAITVGDIMRHRSGLPAVSPDFQEGDLYDWPTITQALAASSPTVPLDGPPVYQNMTYGYLLGEVLQRAGGALLPALIAAELTGPLDADFHIALNDAAIDRCATLSQDDPGGLFRAIAEAPDSLFARSMTGFDRRETFNTSRWRRAAIGSGSGHATARAIAKLYDQLVAKDGLIGPSLQALARLETGRCAGDDPILGVPIRYGTGFELSLPPSLDFGPNPSTAGYWGAGGALGFADPEAGVAFGYVTRHMAAELGCSARGRALVTALYDAVGGDQR